MKLKLLLFLTLLSFISGMISCAAEKATMDTDQAWFEIYTAIDYKANECKSRPSYPMIVFNDPDTYSVRLCSLSIIHAECPFENYPIFCIEMLGVDLPLIGPKQ